MAEAWEDFGSEKPASVTTTTTAPPSQASTPAWDDFHPDDTPGFLQKFGEDLNDSIAQRGGMQKGVLGTGEGPIPLINPITEAAATLVDSAYNTAAVGIPSVLEAGFKQLGEPGRQIWGGIEAALNSTADLAGPAVGAQGARATALQKLFQDNATVDKIMEFAPDLDRKQVEAAVQYRDAGGEGASFVPKETAKKDYNLDVTDNGAIKTYSPKGDYSSEPLPQEAGGKLGLSVIDRGSNIEVRNIGLPDSLRGNGTAKELYSAAADDAKSQGKPLVSSPIISQGAASNWEALKAEGYPVVKNPNATLVESPDVHGFDTPRWMDSDADKPVYEMRWDLDKRPESSGSKSVPLKDESGPIQTSSLPVGVSKEDLSRAIDNAKGLRMDAQNFKGTPEPRAEDLFKATPEPDLKSLEGRLAAEAEKFKTEPSAPVPEAPYVTDVSPVERPDTVAEDTQVISQHGLTPSHFASDADMTDAVDKLFGRRPPEQASFDGEVSSPLPEVEPTLTKKTAESEFQDSLVAAKPQTAKEWKSTLEESAQNFLSSKAKESEADPIKAPEPAVESPVEPSQSPAADRLVQALKEAKPLTRDQQRLYSVERSKRVKELLASRHTNAGGEEGLRAELSALKGELPKVDIASIRDKFSQDDVTELLNTVRDHPGLRPLETIAARKALVGLLDGKLPTPSELGYLGTVFPKEIVETLVKGRTTLQRLQDAGANALNLPRALMSTLDLSAPFTQGVALVGRREFWNSFGSMFKQFGSEKAFNAVQDSIRHSPNYDLMKEYKLALTDRAAGLSDKEEQFMSNWAEKIPLVGKAVRASDRAYTGFLNKLRADTFDSFVKKYKDLGIDLSEHPEELKSWAEFVNNATGRGDLGKYNGAAPLLSGMLFSPRLMASRINLLRPDKYVRMAPLARKEAMKDMLKFGGIVAGTLALAKAGGASVEVDPRSSDFGKIKVGDTRYNILGGFGPYGVLAARLYSNQTKTIKGDVKDFGKGYKPQTRFTASEDFIRSKASPVASFVADFMDGKDVTGQPFDAKTAVASRFVPMFLQDFTDAVKDDGVEGAIKGAPGVMIPTQTFKPRETKSETKAKAAAEGQAWNDFK